MNDVQIEDVEDCVRLGNNTALGISSISALTRKDKCTLHNHRYETTDVVQDRAHQTPVDPTTDMDLTCHDKKRRQWRPAAKRCRQVKHQFRKQNRWKELSKNYRCQQENSKAVHKY